jgi:uncharacterized protein (TIRG00374 family)
VTPGQDDAGPAEPPRGPRTGAWVRGLLGAVTAGAFLYLTLRHTEWAAIRGAWSTVAPGAIALGVVSLVAGWTVRVVRWWWMLRVLEPKLPLANCARPFLASFAVNNTVPLRAGDFVRAFGYRDALGVGPAQVLGTLVVERVLDVLMLLSIFFFCLVGVARGAVPPSFVTAGTVLFALSLGAILALVLAPRVVEAVVARVLLGPLANRAWAARAHGVATQFFATLTRVLTPRRAVQLLLLSMVAWALEGGLYVAVAAALRTGGGALGPWFALTTGTLATLLPSSPGYVGTFDYFAIVGLTAYGASRTAAAAFALLTHVILWLPSTVVGGLCLISLRRGRRRASAAVERAGARRGWPASEQAAELS